MDNILARLQDSVYQDVTVVEKVSSFDHRATDPNWESDPRISSGLLHTEQRSSSDWRIGGSIPSWASVLVYAQGAVSRTHRQSQHFFSL